MKISVKDVDVYGTEKQANGKNKWNELRAAMETSEDLKSFISRMI